MKYYGAVIFLENFLLRLIKLRDDIRQNGQENSIQDIVKYESKHVFCEPAENGMKYHDTDEENFRQFFNFLKFICYIFDYAYANLMSTQIIQNGTQTACKITLNAIYTAKTCILLFIRSLIFFPLKTLRSHFSCDDFQAEKYADIFKPYLSLSRERPMAQKYKINVLFICDKFGSILMIFLSNEIGLYRDFFFFYCLLFEKFAVFVIVCAFIYKNICTHRYIFDSVCAFQWEVSYFTVRMYSIFQWAAFSLFYYFSINSETTKTYSSIKYAHAAYSLWKTKWFVDVDSGSGGIPLLLLFYVLVRMIKHTSLFIPFKKKKITFQTRRSLA